MSGRALLGPKAADHLARLCGMFGSDFDGEVVNAARLADAYVKQLGLRWPDVISAPPAEWQTMAKFCRDKVYLLRERERDFIENTRRWRRMPTDKQLAWLEAIYARLGGGQ